jgi:7-cyano-7-deazaguanine synthase in queuosine biosynthesis
MQNKRYIICGNVDFPIPEEFQEDALYYHMENNGDESRKVTLKIGDFREPLCRNIPKRFHDLLEIATYVYCADQEVYRGTDQDAKTFCSHWRRYFHFVIPVRDLNFWQQTDIQSILTGTLGFLSDDRYDFTFVQQTNGIPFQQFLDFDDDAASPSNPEQVIMFSGGLDSLGGAIEEIINQKRRVVLVNHRPTSKLNRKYRDLAQMITDKASDACKPIHIRVKINKKKEMNKEYTQRSRSFLYVTIGATIAKMLNLKSVRFYENGVISLNLPVCEHVVGGRSTRTTHPRVINGFAKILSMASEDDFVVENPFIDKTKGEVVKLIADSGCAEMVGASISCTHTWEMKEGHWHCGTCSQCIDRRFAVAAAGVTDHDPLDQYAVDVFTDTRKKDVHVAEDKTMYAGYLERANQAQNISDCAEFAAKFPEVLRAVKYLPGDAGQVIDRIFDMYKRHAAEVNKVVDAALAEHSTAIRQRTLPEDCLVRIVHESYLPTSVSAIPTATEPLPDNIFRRKGEIWQLRFDGSKEFLLLPTKGAEYICTLLSRVNEEIPIIELAGCVAIDHCNHLMDVHEAIESGLQVSTSNPIMRSIGKVSDWKALQQYRDELAIRQGDLERAKQDNNNVEVAQCEHDIAMLWSVINESIGIGKRLTEADDKIKKVTDAARKAVKDTITKIKEQKAGKELGEHLESYILKPVFGSSPAYRPNIDIKWEIRPLKNR